MPARIPEEVRIKQINDIVGITLRGWSEPYRGAKTGAFLTCDTCGYGWKSDIFTIVKSKRCPSCIGVARKGMHVRESEINAIRGIKFISWKSWIGGAYSRANVSCDDCGTVWDATVNNLVNKKRGCPGCAPEKISTVKRLSTESIIDRINSVEGASFIRFVGEYRNARSKVVLRCNACGIEFSTTSGSVVNSWTGCKQCAATRRADARRIDENVAISRINNIAGIRLIGWEFGRYTGVSGKAVVECDNGHVWSSTVIKLESGRGCPSCAKTGYDPSKTGTIYALRSECGRYVKVGISNKPEIRVDLLKKRTPFSFYLVESITNTDGVVAKSLESYFHKKYGRSGLSGFDGATEWLPFSGDLLSDFIAKKRVYERV